MQYSWLASRQEPELFLSSSISRSGLRPTRLPVNTLRTGDADLRFYFTTVQDG